MEKAGRGTPVGDREHLAEHAGELLGHLSRGAEPPAGSVWVARRSSRANDSCSPSSGTPSGRLYLYVPWKPRNSKVSTASARPTVYRSELGEGPSASISGAW